MLEQVLIEDYKKFDYLNQDKNKPLVKILVSYIKPYFLFKSDILTPIHLGRAIEKDSSKDGVISDEDVNWLHENCIGDDDFETNISHVNRRVGFFTGTYWAWKNYDRLNNPEYFGSFGYRKLFSPKCLEKIQDVDIIVPKKHQYIKPLKERFLYNFGINLLTKTIDSLGFVYPDEIIQFINFINDNKYRDHELYIFKKTIFFQYCEWIFPLMNRMLNYPQEELKTIENLNERNPLFISLKDKRDVAFSMELYTDYFIYKLLLDKSIRFYESDLMIVNTNIEDLNKRKQIFITTIREKFSKKERKI